MSKTLIVGHRGNIARRYIAIFNYLKLPWIGIDIGDTWPDSDQYDRVLICTPTAQHIKDCWKCVYVKKPFLCEKPVSKDPNEIEELMLACERDGIEGQMVNNWVYAIGDLYPTIIRYDYFQTGNDGLYWDCIQPIYIGTEVHLKNTLPVFECVIGGEEITQQEFNYSYMKMIKDWMAGKPLWSMKDALQATRKVIDYVDSHTSKEYKREIPSKM